MGRFTALSLFTGAGGLDFGFEAAGFDTAVAVEMDKRCAATLAANREWPLIPKDVTRVPSKMILAVSGLAVGEADVLIGGPPCQPFSKSGFWATGQSGRLNDLRARTLTSYMRILGDTLPKAFLLENVEGLGFRGKDEGLHFISREIARINRRCGTSYSLSMSLLNAADFGVPQTRRRLFIIGSRDGVPFRFPHPTHGESLSVDGACLQPVATAWDALWDLDSNDPELALRGKWADLLPSVPEGQNYLWHTDRGGGEPLFGWRRRYWNFLLKLEKERPAWTLQAQPGPATGPFHWANRRLSVAEMKRLQTFPDDVSVVGTLADAQRQLGNAVPSLLAEVLAREIRGQLLGSTSSVLRPRLQLAPAPMAPLSPRELAKVPDKYLSLRAQHSPHPGVGRGYRATRSSPNAPIAIAAE
jgi:DNA (cytosine-5)-methyltransferase 1